MARFKVLGILRAEMNYILPLDLTTATLATGATTMAVGTGQGAKINAALAQANPGDSLKALIGSEVITIPPQVATDGAVTIARAAEGSTDAVHTAGTASVKLFAPVWISRSNQFTLNPNRTALNFDGDDTREIIYVSNGIDGDLRSSEFNTDVLDQLVAAAAVTTGLPTDAASRYYPELGTYPFVELRIFLKAYNVNTLAQQRLRVYVPQVLLNFPYALGQMGSNVATQHDIQWTSQFATSDIAGRPLQGASSQVHYAYEVLTS
jgi:hypothetical protein